MTILKIETLSTQKSAMTLLFIDFDFSPIYKADLGGSLMGRKKSAEFGYFRQCGIAFYLLRSGSGSG